MSGITNPFAQIGDYRGNSVAQNEDLVTTAYLTGLPDPKNISNGAVSLIFKQLLKRDSRTKLRALKDFEQWLSELNSDEEIEDSIHLAFIQMYAKLSNDVSPEIRSESQQVLGSLYKILGKKSSKYLKYAVGPWIVNQRDPDLRAATAAQASLKAVFPDDKIALLVAKFQDSIREFIYDCCNNATAQTLSDERYLTKEEASQKYTRLVRCCLNTLIDEPLLCQLETSEIQDLVESGRLWKFFSSSDSGLARSALKLASTYLKDLQPEVPLIWKELLRAGRKNVGGPGVALDVIHLMNILTRSHSEVIWPSDESARRDTMASLGQFLVSDPPHPIKFWPLLYNLVLMIPEPPKADLTPLYKPLEKVVLQLRHNHELEDSVWGCFISLAAKMGPSYVQRVFRAVEQRCKSPNVPTKSIAKYLARFVDVEGVQDLVKSQLAKIASDNKLLEYAMIMAETHKFGPEIEKLALPHFSPEDIALLVEVDKTLHVPEMEHPSLDAAWLKIAAKCVNVDAQKIVDLFVDQHEALEKLLQLSHDLTLAGVKCNVDFAVDSTSEPAVIESAIAARGELISEKHAQALLHHVVEQALVESVQLSWASRLLRSNLDFVQKLAMADAEFADDLNMLSASSQDLSQSLKALGLESSSKAQSGSSSHSGENGIEFFKADIQTLSLLAPEESVVNELRAVPPLAENFETGLAFSLRVQQHLFEASDFFKRQKTEQSVKPEILANVLILHEFVKSWFPKMPIKNAVNPDLPTNNITTAFEILWEKLASENAGVAYHAALALTNQAFSSQVSAKPFKREYFSNPSLQGALLAHFCAVNDNPQFDNMQRSLIRDAKIFKLKTNEWMLIDRSLISENDKFKISTNRWEESLLDTVFAIQTFGSSITNLAELAFESENEQVELAGIMSLSDIEDLEQLIIFLSNFPSGNAKRIIVASKCLSLVNAYLGTQDIVQISDIESLQSLINSEEIYSPWVALQVLRHLDGVPEEQLTLDGTLEDQSSVLVSWIIRLALLKDSKELKAPLRFVFEWIVKRLRSYTPSSSDIASASTIPPTPNPSHIVALNLLFILSSNRPNDVREWYRDVRDKTLLKHIDNILSIVIIPAILRSVRERLAAEDFGEEVEVTLNEKQREIRASREIEDDYAAEIVIALPDRYPGKPAEMSIRNLGSVSEAKKRGWLLEARQKLQSDGVLGALNGLLQRLNNFLDGVDPCAICYMTVNDNNKLPNKDCSQCHNIYHADCLYKWFSTNGNKLCPMCRTPM